MDETVAIIGGGVAGLSAALELADRGLGVTLVDRDDHLGGRAITYGCKATDECSKCNVCLALDVLREVSDHPNIAVSTDSEVRGFAGSAGDFKLTVRRGPQYIDRDACTGCGLCSDRCPVEGAKPLCSSEVFGEQAYRFDPNQCPHLEDGSCGICEDVCPTGAIHLDAQGAEDEIEVGSVIVATGFRPFPAETMLEYGYGHHPDVITGYEFEGEIARQRTLREYLDGRHRVAFIQCVGSRDEHHNRYCSQVCCSYALRMARLIRTEVPETEVTVYFMDLQSFGEDWLAMHRACAEDEGIHLVRGKPARVNLGFPLSVVYEDVREGHRGTNDHDMLVLSVGIEPGEDTVRLSQTFGISCDADGFLAGGVDGIETNVPGLYLAGTCAGPRDIEDSMAHARRAAHRAISSLRSRSLCKTD